MGQRIASAVSGVPGAADVRLEETSGLPLLTITPDRRSLAGYGLNPGQLQSTVATAVGGRVAGQLFEGDRRFDIVVRLPEQQAAEVAAAAMSGRLTVTLR